MKVFDIQHFSTVDGPGIRTVIFLKGCPLSCEWCHNPESKEPRFEIFYNKEKCIGCKMCESVCELGLHTFSDNGHIFERNDCTSCMRCSAVCTSKALEKCGEEKCADEIIKEVLKDKLFYEQSGGGMTLSGGEPLMQYDESLELLKKAKENGIHTALETSGYCTKSLLKISKYVDLWLYDIKLISDAEHIEHTGVSNKIILENLQRLDEIGAEIILRLPIIPKVNLKEEHFLNIAELVNSLRNVKAIHFEKYHPLGIDKASRLGKTQKYSSKEFLKTEGLKPFIEKIRDNINVKIEIM